MNVKNKIYTEREFEILDMELIAYYKNEEEMTEEELEEIKEILEDVKRDDYNKLLDKISKEFNF